MKKTVCLIIIIVQWITMACFAQRNSGWLVEDYMDINNRKRHEK